jgi:phosphosulfolactate synthase
MKEERIEFTEELLPFSSREGKPRDKGLTVANDLFAPFNKDSVKDASEYIDSVKIGLSLPLFLEKSKLVERVRFYHDLGIRVSSGGTLVQVALKKNFLTQALERLRALSFDTVEISESALNIPTETKWRIIEAIEKNSMDYVIEVGNKNSPMPLDHFVAKIQEAFDLKSKKVVIEAGERGEGVGFYDSEGRIEWETLNEIVGHFGPPNLIFEAPTNQQRLSLILEFGPNVNLASVDLDNILPLEMHRLGLTSESLGISPVSRTPEEGSPAAKFVYYIIKSEHPIDQSTLIKKSSLPKRTLQGALTYLVKEGFVRQVGDLNDLRKHKYTVA